MPTKEEVQEFLEVFKRQKKAYGIMFYQRKKNLKTLLELEISAKQRSRLLEKLQVEDYYKGPREDGVLKGTQFWEFGKQLKKREIYIKISLGLEGKPVRCLSFHIAERPIEHPFKA